MWIFPAMARPRPWRGSPINRGNDRTGSGDEGGKARACALAGADHISLTVTDLDRSERLLHRDPRTPPTGRLRPRSDPGPPADVVLGWTQIRHDATDGTPFTELNTGLDHLGFAASSRDELVEWERRFVAHGVEHTPIRDMELGYHLNFRDPDNIALEITVSNDVARPVVRGAARQEIPRQEIDTRLREYLRSLEPAPTGMTGAAGASGRYKRDIWGPANNPVRPCRRGRLVAVASAGREGQLAGTIRRTTSSRGAFADTVSTTQPPLGWTSFVPARDRGVDRAHPVSERAVETGVAVDLDRVRR